MKKNFLLFLSSVFVGLFIVEMFLRLFLPQNTSMPWRIYLDDGLLLNKNNGYANHKPNISKDLIVKYTFGEFHNRTYGLKNKEKKILILGDSSTFGWLLNDHDTFVYKIAKKFPDYEFINSAAGGLGTSDQLRYYEKFCKQIKPVKTIYFINFADIERSKKSNLYYLDENNNLKSGVNKIPSIAKYLDNNIIYDFLVSNFHIVGFLRNSYVMLLATARDLSYYKKRNIRDEKGKIIITENENLINIKKSNQEYLFEKKLFIKLNNLSRQCNSQLILINLAWHNVAERPTDTLKFLNDNENFFKDENLNYVNLSNEMEKIYENREKFIIKGDGHPNAEANKFYSIILYKKLKYIIE